MYTRRNVCRLATTGSIAVLAGCSGGDSPPEETTETPRQVGQSVNHNGVQATVSEPFISTGPLRWSENEDQATETPREGGAFLFYKISLRNMAENERWFPESDSIVLYLNGEQAGDQYESMPNDLVSVGGKVYESLTSKILDKGADTGVFPGVEIKGWNVHEVPSEIRLRSAQVGIELGRTPDVGDLREFRWQLA